MCEKYAQIILSINHKQVDRTFTYRIPETLAPEALEGMRAVVPFGRGNKPREGYILHISPTPGEDIDREKIKDILSLPDTYPMFTQEMLQLAEWMKDKYYTTMSECLRCILPAGVKIKNNYLYEIENLPESLSKKQWDIYNYMEDRGGAVYLRELTDEFGEHVQSALNILVKNNILLRRNVSKFSNYTQMIKFVRLNPDMDETARGEYASALGKKGKQADVLNLLAERGQMALGDILKAVKISESPVKTLAKKSVVRIDAVETRRSTIAGYQCGQADSPFHLTEEQKAAVETAISCLETGQARAFKKPLLIHGVTGSGKTEVYMQLIDKVIQGGKQAVMLVPEISLTPQTVDRFVSRFGDKVAVTHSGLSNGERFDQWKNAREGRISVMIGPRSAVFAPFENLGVIVIDEEHENTYKSEITPKYDTRQVAVQRAELTGALVVLGSATPSVESYQKAEAGEYRLTCLHRRINSMFPDVEVVDMREELRDGNRSIFSGGLYEAIGENLKSGRQTILFLNRRGHSTFVSCRQCGYVMKCDDCNINYTYHLYSDKLVCHYCGQEAENPENCPQCGSKYIKYFGVGTQKIEDEVKSCFPGATVLRMDMDTTARKNSHEEILSRFRRNEAQILIGTQMIAKGLDFPNVTLVGVIAADVSLNAGDYRSGEVTFQLLTQVAGRAGRAMHGGRVFIQTYNPEHYAIMFARDNDYQEFFRHEIALRRQMDYPPFTHIFTALFTGESEKKLITSLFKLLDIMKHYNKSGDFEILGPSPAHISKIRKRYRWKLIVKCKDEIRLKNFMLYCVEKLRSVDDLTDIHINLTMDPAVSA